MKMKTGERIWWSELADQYEEWGENPPEEYTCISLYTDKGFFRFNVFSCYPSEVLRPLWASIGYPDSEAPVGYNEAEVNPRTPEKVSKFCFDMADAIREEISHAL